jgi:hypothetical protein
LQKILFCYNHYHFYRFFVKMMLLTFFALALHLFAQS